VASGGASLSSSSPAMPTITLQLQGLLSVHKVETPPRRSSLFSWFQCCTISSSSGSGPIKDKVEDLW
jgi:hypothetical protein